MNDDHGHWCAHVIMRDDGVGLTLLDPPRPARACAPGGRSGGRAKATLSCERRTKHTFRLMVIVAAWPCLCISPAFCIRCTPSKLSSVKNCSRPSCHATFLSQQCHRCTRHCWSAVALCYMSTWARPRPVMAVQCDRSSPVSCLVPPSTMNQHHVMFRCFTV